MSSFLVIIFQSGRIFEISENVQDSGLLFVKKYLLLKLHFFFFPNSNTCAVRCSGKAETEDQNFSCFGSRRGMRIPVFGLSIFLKLGNYEINAIE